MKNWKTTLVGAIGAVGAYLCTQDNVILKTTGIIIGILTPVLMGAVAKDANVTGGTTAQTTEAEKRVVQ